MAILKLKDIKSMNAQDKQEKINELRMELIKAASGKKKENKIKEIKKTIARLLTLK